MNRKPNTAISAVIMEGEGAEHDLPQHFQAIQAGGEYVKFPAQLGEILLRGEASEIRFGGQAGEIRFGGQVGQIRFGGEVGEMFLRDHVLAHLPELGHYRLQAGGGALRSHGVYPLFRSIGDHRVAPALHEGAEDGAFPGRFRGRGVGARWRGFRRWPGRLPGRFGG